ncbi:MAG: glycosyltransferase family 2 protein [Pseudaminobacter sp.]|nr:glycosyltransferase family 2 protein [Pseudaminobacter sp.]
MKPMRASSAANAAELRKKISVVIPVYKSETILDHTLDRTIAFFEANDLPFEIILVNDNSPDGVWDVIERRSAADSRIKGISLVKNYGQHIANFAGFRYVTGDCVVTMDDDLQNPPEEITKLISAWNAGADFVVGRFERKQHGGLRRLGTSAMHQINKSVFKGPKGFHHSNFRLIDRSVIDRLNAYKGRRPYTSGLAMMFCNRPINVVVSHAQREEGASNYTLRRLIALAWNVVFNYSRLPMRILLFIGFALSLVMGLYAGFLLIRAFFYEATIPGWTSLGVLISFSNAIILLMLSLIAEYLSVILDQLRSSEPYHVRDMVGIDA